MSLEQRQQPEAMLYEDRLFTAHMNCGPLTHSQTLRRQIARLDSNLAEQPESALKHSKAVFYS